MSGGIACVCPERKEPLRVDASSNRPARLWRVLQRYCNHSAFNGRHRTASDYSSVHCLRCGAHWRTKGSYVGALRDSRAGDLNVGPGIEGYEAKMEVFGREPVSNSGEVRSKGGVDPALRRLR